MALQGVVRVEVPNEAVFPFGALCLGVEPESDFDRRDEEDDQKRDAGTPAADGDERGERVWVVRVVDLDPEALKFGGSAEVKVRIVAPHQPVPPGRTDARPPLVEFDGLTMTPYVNGKRCRGVKDPKRGCGCRVGFSIRATAMRAAGAAPGSGNGKAPVTKTAAGSKDAS